jgi:hypothetical protein
VLGEEWLRDWDLLKELRDTHWFLGEATEDKESVLISEAFQVLRSRVNALREIRDIFFN